MEIVLKSGVRVLLDDDRADLAMLRGWYVHSSGYVGREVRVEGKRTIVFLHHLVLGVAPDRRFRVDHINRNTLDNRSANLRRCTASQNAQNRAPVNAHGKPRGVSARKGRWVARATLNYRTYQIGTFSTQEEAVAALSRWRAEHMTHSEHDKQTV